MDGSPKGGWTRSQVFPPRGSSSTMDAKTSSLTSEMSEMALDMEPRPKKIRRRNAIKPLDQAHLPLLHNTLGEPFESASLLQSLEDGLLASSPSGGEASTSMGGDCDDAMPAPLQFHRQPSLPSAKRKIPRPRLKANSTATFKSKHHRQKDADMDIHSIRLHQDLTSHAPKNEILPESILKSYRDQYQSSLATLAATAAETSAAAVTVSSSTAPSSCHAPSPCNALVLYTPPEKTIHHVLNKVRESEAKTTISKSKQFKPPPASLVTSSSMDLDMS